MTNEYNNILDYVSGSWLETIWILIIIILGVIAYRWIKNKGIQNTNQKEEKQMQQTIKQAAQAYESHSVGNIVDLAKGFNRISY